MQPAVDKLLGIERGIGVSANNTTRLELSSDLNPLNEENKKHAAAFELELKATQKGTTSPASTASNLKNDTPDYVLKEIKVVGVTFKNGRIRRQTILRKIKFRDGEFEDGVNISLKVYDFDNKPAVGVYANEQQIGNVPADLVEWYLENLDRIISIYSFEVYGGGNDDFGESLNYGARFVIKLNKA